MGLMEKFANPEWMHSMSLSDKMAGAGITTLMGMGITFAVLILLWGCISLMTNFTKRSAQAIAPKATASVSKQKAGSVVEDKTEIAVIMAAIAAYEGGTLDNLVIRKINRVSGNTTTWGNAGRSDCIDSRKF